MNRTEETARAYLRSTLRFPDDEIDEILEIGRLALARTLAELERAVAGRDVRGIGDAGHAMKGMLRNMGLEETAGLTRRLCALAENDVPAGLGEAAAALRRDLEAFLCGADQPGTAPPGPWTAAPPGLMKKEP